jgi:hypothetical protein
MPIRPLSEALNLYVIPASISCPHSQYSHQSWNLEYFIFQDLKKSWISVFWARKKVLKNVVATCITVFNAFVNLAPVTVLYHFKAIGIILEQTKCCAYFCLALLSYQATCFMLWSINAKSSLETVLNLLGKRWKPCFQEGGRLFCFDSPGSLTALISTINISN